MTVPRREKKEETIATTNRASFLLMLLLFLYSVLVFSVLLTALRQVFFGMIVSENLKD